MKAKCSAKLCAAAKRAGKYAAKSHDALRIWAELFEIEYGHNDISDALVETIDYCTGNLSKITREFIHQNSEID